MSIEVRPANARFCTEAEGRTTWHSFSFGEHYDPRNVGFGALIAHHEEQLPAGTGYPDHPHVDTEIVTWVLDGALRHTDTAGNSGVLLPGEVQVLSAGSGVVHSEVADEGATRFVQAWIRPDEAGLRPSYSAERADLGATWCCLASGRGDGLRLGARDAALYAARLDDGGSLQLPEAPRLHVFVVTGAATLGDHELVTGDAGRLVHEPGRTLTATRDGSAVLIWALA